jgi:hypothetical protein
MNKKNKKNIEEIKKIIKNDDYYTYKMKKQVVSIKHYKPYVKKYDYIDNSNNIAFLNQFLNDKIFLRLYKKMNKSQKKAIRQHRKRNNLESVYNKVKEKYNTNS